MENNVNETNKNKKVFIGLMACGILLLLIALVYILFVKKDDTQPKNENNNQQETANNNEEDPSYKPWMNYILKQNITSIELIEYPCPEDKFEKRTITVTTEQLKNIFNKFMNYKMRVSYIGGAGWVCGRTLNIKYLKDGKTYELIYVPNYFIPSSSDDGNSTILDKDLENALYSSVDIKENEEAKGQDGVFSHYDIVDEDGILNEYFQ